MAGGTARWRGPQRRPEAWLTVAALLVFSLLLAVAQYSQLEQRFRADLAVQAQIVADTASAALVFEAPQDATEILGTLRRSPAVEEATLWSLRDRALARYREALHDDRWLYRWAGHVELNLPVWAQNERVGRLTVRASRVGVLEDLVRFVATAAGLLAAALVVAGLVTQRLRANVQAAEERTQHLALHDALTDLPNRESFRWALEEAARNATVRPAALLVLDLDNFKQINDSHGHPAGDAVLRRVASVLRAQCRPGDLAARLAGDEFALLLGAPVGREHARSVAERLVAELPNPQGAELPVHVSVGGALLPDDARDASDAMRWADAAMYQAKRTGKNGFQFFSAEIGQALKRRLELEQELPVALEAGDLTLAYQPLFDGEGKVCGLEALSRWPHAVRGAVSPGEFIPIAEGTGLIVELSLHNLTVLARDAAQWRQAGLTVPRVAVNLSSRQCRQSAHRAQLLDTLERLQLGPDAVEFELTEGTLFDDVEAPDSLVALLQQRGYHLSLDDFGTGYSSLAYLRRVRCQKLKLDRLFVHGVAANAEARLLVEAVIGLSHAMGMQVVAEGVERRSDWAWLRSLRCDLFQGFGLARPLAPADVQALLQAQADGARTRMDEAA